MANLAYNFRWVGSAQKRQATRESYDRVSESFARILLREVAIATSKRTQENARRSLVTRIKSEIRREIIKMAQTISRFVVQPERAKGPSGIARMAASGVSQTMQTTLGRGMSGVGYYDVGRSNVNWRERSLAYMRWKKRKNYGTDWFRNRGHLQRQLGRESTYNGFGPIVVLFHPNRKQTPIGGNVNLTSTGRTGRVSETYEVGRLEVIAMGRITAAMLPSLASGDVGDATPVGGQRISNLITGQRTREKLSGLSTGEGNSPREYRPVIEPFVSYYLTRAIPNAVFLRAEKLVQEGQLSASQGSTRAGVRSSIGGQFIGT